ncbi:MAG: hypothetical protein ACRYFU_25740 [Janthinobacterium lividum]
MNRPTLTELLPEVRAHPESDRLSSSLGDVVSIMELLGVNMTNIGGAGAWKEI